MGRVGRADNGTGSINNISLIDVISTVGRDLYTRYVWRECLCIDFFATLKRIVLALLEMTIVVLLSGLYREGSYTPCKSANRFYKIFRYRLRE